MSNRPRPVTATVTKPSWMKIPDQEHRAALRSHSVESNDSTESLTELLDRVSYKSSDDLSEEPNSKEKETRSDLDKTYSKPNRPSRKTDKIEEAIKTSCKTKNDNMSDKSPERCKSTDSNFSAWEQWVVLKAKENRQMKREEKLKKKEEAALKEKEEQEKQKKLQKAEVVRQEWTEQKNKEQTEKSKEDKVKQRNEKLKKQEIEQQIKEKAEEKYALWADFKKKEDRERRKKVKEDNQKIQQHEENRKKMADHKFKEWLKQASTRPKSAPNSFGYLAGKMTGYHDRSAYPTPSFYNPMPWHPVAIPPSTQKAEHKTKKTRAKPYKWNPEKYF